MVSLFPVPLHCIWKHRECNSEDVESLRGCGAAIAGGASGKNLQRIVARGLISKTLRASAQSSEQRREAATRCSWLQEK